jgi:hypothetical protein
VNDRHLESLQTLGLAFREGRYADAIALASDLMNSAALVSSDEVKEVGRAVAEGRDFAPIFGSSARAGEAAPFFEGVLKDLEFHLSAESAIAAGFAMKVAPFYVSQGRAEKAVNLVERAVLTFSTLLGPRHPQTRLARSTLAIFFRNMGRADRADGVFADTGICQHLRPAQEYIRSLGVRVFDVCTPWTQNCRTWVYFDKVVLDVESLKSRFGLPECVVVHSHRGTHDGAEHGLVCQADHDALMGVHPEVAGGCRLIG